MGLFISRNLIDVCYEIYRGFQTALQTAELSKRVSFLSHCQAKGEDWQGCFTPRTWDVQGLFITSLSLLYRITHFSSNSFFNPTSSILWMDGDNRMSGGILHFVCQSLLCTVFSFKHMSMSLLLIPVHLCPSFQLRVLRK